MDKLVLSKKDLKFIKRQLKFPWFLIFVLVFSMIMGIVYYVGIFHIYQPNIDNLFKDVGEMQIKLNDFLETNNAVYFKPAVFFFALLTGLLIGNIISHLKLVNILKKLEIDKLIEK